MKRILAWLKRQLITDEDAFGPCVMCALEGTTANHNHPTRRRTDP